jgi:TfoX/Sxy family transcriptional regulator of competence genes
MTMASDESFVTYVAEQMSNAGAISSRKMFGEYAIYCGEKVVALVCDNQVFVKPTAGDRAMLGSPREAPPYPGARPHFLMDDGLDDREALSALIAVTARELPAPKPKPPKKTAKPKAAKK